MDVIKEIFQNSAIGPYPNWSKGIVISLFTSIVFTLISMLVIIVVTLPNTTWFGY